MKNRRNRHNRQKIIKLPEISSKSLVDMGDLVFESIDGQTNDIKELRIPAHLFLKMLETMQADKDNREFIQELKEYTMLITVDVSNILFDDLAEIEQLYFELLQLIYTLVDNKKDIESNRSMAMCLMDLYPFIGEIVKNHEQLMIYSEHLPKGVL